MSARATGGLPLRQHDVGVAAAGNARFSLLAPDHIIGEMASDWLAPDDVINSQIKTSIFKIRMNCPIMTDVTADSQSESSPLPQIGLAIFFLYQGHELRPSAAFLVSPRELSFLVYTM